MTTLSPVSNRVRQVLIAVWPLLLAVVLIWPLLSSTGHPLGRDLIFVPEQPWTDGTWGLGPVAPRAIPLDAVVSALTTLLDGAVWARVLILAILAGAGWGAALLARSHGLTAALVAGGFAVWNPYVAERLALGQWALLAGYAAVPWLIRRGMRYARTGRHGDLAVVVAWAACGSLTPSGGLVVLATLAVVLVCAERRRWWPLILAVAMQGTWISAGLLGTTAGASDRAGVAVFAPDGEGPGGAVVAVLGLGGIWDSLSEPASRTTWWGALTAVVVSAVVLAFWWRLRRRPAPALRALMVLGLLALAVVLLTALPLGTRLLETVVAEVPGAGLLRDSQKLLAPYAILAAVAFGVLSGAAVRRLAGLGVEVFGSVAVVAVLAPVVLLPDATTVVWPTVRPVHYPAGFAEVAEHLDAAAREGDASAVVTLPWRSYRLFAWGSEVTASDPAIRWFDRTVVVDDDLQVGRRLVPGESKIGRQVGEALRAEVPLTQLGDLGIGWVLVYRDDRGAAKLDPQGLQPVYSDRWLALYRVPGVTEAGHAGPRERAVVIGAHLLYATLGLGAAGWALVTVAQRLRRRRSESATSAIAGDTLQ